MLGLIMNCLLQIKHRQLINYSPSESSSDQSSSEMLSLLALTDDLVLFRVSLALSELLLLEWERFLREEATLVVASSLLTCLEGRARGEFGLCLDEDVVEEELLVPRRFINWARRWVWLNSRHKGPATFLMSSGDTTIEPLKQITETFIFHKVQSQWSSKKRTILHIK